MKKHKLLMKLTALLLTVTIAFSCVSITATAMPPMVNPFDFVVPANEWPRYTTSGSSQADNEDEQLSEEEKARRLSESLKEKAKEAEQKRADNSFLEKIKTEFVKANLPNLIKETVKSGAKRVGKWLSKNYQAAKNWLNTGQRSIKWFSKAAGKVAAKWASRFLYLKGIYDFIQDPSAPYLSPYLKLCCLGLKGFNTFVGPFLPPNVGLALTAAEVILTSTEVVDFINDLYMKLVNSRGPLRDMLLLPDFVLHTLYIGGMLLFDKLFMNHGKSPAAVVAAPPDTVLNMMKEKQKGATPAANGIGVYKPNIYLYPIADTDVNVTFEQPQLLTVTDPPYDNGWNVTAKPDGTLNDNGSEYGYLFYESVTYPSYYQTEEGFAIPSDAREETFTSILRGYGLSETEIADFCEFWCEKLESGRDYAMYPQLTETIDITMPVTVTPAPDTRFRIWFAFKADEAPKKTSAPEKFEREGFTMVEWGGLIINE